MITERKVEVMRTETRVESRCCDHCGAKMPTDIYGTMNEIVTFEVRQSWSGGDSVSEEYDVCVPCFKKIAACMKTGPRFGGS